MRRRRFCGLPAASLVNLWKGKRLFIRAIKTMTFESDVHDASIAERVVLLMVQSFLSGSEDEKPRISGFPEAGRAVGSPVHLSSSTPMPCSLILTETTTGAASLMGPPPPEQTSQ